MVTPEYCVAYKLRKASNAVPVMVRGDLSRIKAPWLSIGIFVQSGLSG